MKKIILILGTTLLLTLPALAHNPNRDSSAYAGIKLSDDVRWIAGGSIRQDHMTASAEFEGQMPEAYGQDTVFQSEFILEMRLPQSDLAIIPRLNLQSVQRGSTVFEDTDHCYTELAVRRYASVQ